jgi:hypothetical protein
LCRGPVHLHAEPGKVAARHVGGLVCQHADHLVGGAGLLNKASVNEDTLAAGNERVDAAVIDQVNVHSTGVDACHLEDRLQVPPHQFLDLGIADQADVVAAGLRLRGRGHHHKLRHQQCNCAQGGNC